MEVTTMAAMANLELVKLFGRATEEEKKKVLSMLGIQQLRDKKDLKKIDPRVVQKAIDYLEKYKGPAETASTRTTLEFDVQQDWTQWLNRIKGQVPEKLWRSAWTLTREENLGKGPRSIRCRLDVGKWDLYSILVTEAGQTTNDAYNEVAGMISRVTFREWTDVRDMQKYRVSNGRDLNRARRKERRFQEWKATYTITEEELQQLGELGIALLTSELMFYAILGGHGLAHGIRLSLLMKTMALPEWSDVFSI